MNAGCHNLVTRTYSDAGTDSDAVYSQCELYRYSLTRIWDVRGSRILFVMLNPSTATELRNDPSVERCERRARMMGFGAFRVCNIFAWRSTDPSILARISEPVGELNNEAILEGCTWADHILCAWGNHGKLGGRGVEVNRLIRSTGSPQYHLGLTKSGHPKHPLYIGYRVAPERWL